MVVVNPYYSAEVHGPYELADVGDVVLEEGGTLRSCQLAYQTLGRITARTTVMPISTDLFFPVEDVAAEQALIPGSTLRVIEDVHGHASLFGLGASFAQQVDEALSALLAADV